MRALALGKPGSRLSVLCLGAHADDVEIGAGGSILQWISAGVRVEAHWCVLSACGERAEEARTAATAFLEGAADATIEFAQFKDGFFPYQGEEIKQWLAELSMRVRPDIIFTHRRTDAHQDHRAICHLTSNLFRDHLILEYEVPKWDGDLDRPNFYVPLTAEVTERKIELLLSHFTSQRSKDWFDAEVFRGMARLRGMECRSPDRYAEGFAVRKAVLS